MSNRYRPPTDLAQRAAAVHVFAAEGGHLLSAANQAYSAPTLAERRSMVALGIQFDGRAFRFAGYRYSRLADALSDARRANGDADTSCSEVVHWSLT